MAIVLRAVLTARAPSIGVIRPDVDQLAEVCAIAAALRCEADIGLRSGHAFLMRVAYQQFWDQEDYASWTRGLILHEFIAAQLASLSRGEEVRELFMREFGLTLDTFVFLAFALFATATAQPGLTFDEATFTSSDEYNISQRDAAAFYALVSTTFTRYRLNAFHRGVYYEGYDPYCLNPLLRWPVLKRPSGRYNVPIPRLLLERAAYGIYYDFLQYLSPANRGAFGNAWGNAFGEYVGELLRLTTSSGAIRNAADVVKTGDVCDWIVDDGRTLLFIECKTRGVSAETKVTGAEACIRRDIDPRRSGSSIVGAVVQLATSCNAVCSRGTRRGRAIGLVVTLDHLYLSNDRRYMHRFIREAAEREFGGELPLDFQLVDARGFEWLCSYSLATRKSIGDLLLEKVDGAGFDFDFMRYATTRPGHVPVHPIFTVRGGPIFEALVARNRTPR